MAQVPHEMCHHLYVRSNSVSRRDYLGQENCCVAVFV